MRPLGQGGQGTTSIVEHIDRQAMPDQYVLKLLHKQNDIDRRKRMYREVASLQTLDIQGVPKVIESNADRYDDISQNLYLVMEYIQGATLQERIKDECMVLPDATSLLIKLVDIASYCHDQGVVHRDIKPDNVILRFNAVDNPVLLDFGQSFNHIESTELLTASEQHLGNRFISLPELQLNSGNRRDIRSDLTQLCGLLFFVLTGHHPVTLVDDESRMPHQRRESLSFLEAIPEAARVKLNRLFDTGFSVSIDNRFQSSNALRAAILSVAEATSNQPPQNADEVLSLLREKISGPHFHERQQIRSLFNEVNRSLSEAQSQIVNRLGPAVSTITGGYSMRMSRLSFENGFGLILLNDEDRQFFPKFKAQVIGSELVVSAHDSDRETELLRSPIAGLIPWGDLVEAAVRYLTEGIARNCSDL
jgi:serine/threonine protein kinase